MIRRSALILVIAGCGRFSVEAPTILDGGADGSTSAASDSGDGLVDGGIDPNVDAGPLALSVAYTYETDANVDSIRAVATSGGQVFFYNQDERTIRLLLDQSIVYANVPPAQEFIVSEKLIWHAVSGTLHRIEIGQADVDLSTGQAGGCVYVDPTKTTVFAADYKGRIISVPYAGTNETEVLTGLNLTWGVAVTDSRLFYTRASNKIVWRSMPNPGAGPETTLLDKLASPQCLTIDREFLYFPTYDDGKIDRVRLDGTEHVTLAQGQQHPTQVAVVGPALYWNSGTKVMRLGPTQ